MVSHALPVCSHQQDLHVFSKGITFSTAMPLLEHTYNNPSAFSSFLHQKNGCHLLKDLASILRSLCSAGILAVRLSSNGQRVPIAGMSPLI